jgi:hypothetical protein
MQLSTLKKMSAQQLYDRWGDAKFPFDYLKGCHYDMEMCLTLHRSNVFGEYCTAPGHKQLQAQVDRMQYHRNGIGTTSEFLKDNLEELYALRLFYDKFYVHTAPASARRERKEKRHVEQLAAQ